jgi:hypothetical protein
MAPFASLLKRIPYTTGIAFFAECLRHSAKTILHSTKSLSSITLDKEHSANISSTKGSLPSTFFRTLGKDFAECQKTLGKEKHSVNKESKFFKKNNKTFFKILGATLQPTILPYPLPYHFSLLF